MSPGAAILVSPSGRVRAHPPSTGGKYWRISVLDITCQRRIHQTTGGATEASARHRVLDLERQYVAHSPAGATATRGSQLFDYYLAADRPKNPRSARGRDQWSPTYTDQTTRIVNRHLRPVLDKAPLSTWGPAHAYEVLDGCATNEMLRRVRRTLSAVLGVGVADGFLRADQRFLHQVTVALRPDARPPRRPRARTSGATSLLDPEESPSVGQVAALARAACPGMKPREWEGLINALAYGGFRIGELFALSADDTAPLHSAGLITVAWQLIEPAGGPKRLAPPKNGFARSVAICDVTPLGFPLRRWLIERAEAATRECAAGTNPPAALFVTGRRHWWTRSNFRTRCFNPAAEAAGWDRTTWVGPVRRLQERGWTVVQTERHDWRHPVHSLRHHYATVARDLWGWTGAELCLNGGWADEAFVMARYYGSTADSYRQALAKQAASMSTDAPGKPRAAWCR